MADARTTLKARVKAAARGLRPAAQRPAAAAAPTPSPGPADFDAWLRRRSLRPLRVELTRESSVGSSRPGTRVLAVVHVARADHVPGLFTALAGISVEHDVVIANVSGAELDVPHERPALTGRVDVYRFPDQGRDILPLAQLVNADVIDPYSLVLRLDAAEAAPLPDAALGRLAGSQEATASILDALAADPGLGVVAAPGGLLGAESWQGCEPTARQLLKRIQTNLRASDLSYPAGSTYWVRAFVLQGLRALQLTPEDFQAPENGDEPDTASAVERLIGYLAGEAGYRQATAEQLPVAPGQGASTFAAGSERRSKARVFPYYLPQFHPFEENNEWWGKGFTEWTNVTAAQPVFRGQKQPLLPSELGFYDLRTPGVIAEQYDLARSYGVEGFMVYHYWFAGKQLMTMPVETIAADEAHGPFCLMWANENWTRTWDGGHTNVLIQQEYDSTPATTFIDDVMHLLTHPRYVRVDGKPLLAVYRPGQMDDFDKVLATWRERAAAAGLPGLMVLHVDMPSYYDGLQVPAADLGLDGTMGFPPHNHKRQPRKRAGLQVDQRFTGRLESYRAMANDAIERLRSGAFEDPYQPCVLVNFDNTARRPLNGTVLYGANPYTFRRWLVAAVESVADRPEDERIVFINAWNEWAEAAVLEPSAPFGRTYLQAVRSAIWD